MNRRSIVWIIAVVLVIVMGYRTVNRIISSKKVQQEKIVPVMVSRPARGIITERLTLTGDVRAESEVSVRPRVAGRVEEIYVKEGDNVDAGAPLLSYVKGISAESDIYEDMVVRSPIDGVVGMKLVNEGEQVTSSVGILSPVLVIYKIDTMKIFASVPEKYYSEIEKNMPCEIMFDAIPGKTFKGKVYNVRPVIDPMSRTTQVEIRINNAGHKIKPGMFAKVDMVLERKQNAVIVPFDSVLGEEQKYVFLAENEKAKQKFIKTGIQEENNIEIVSGLTTSDNLIIMGQRVLKDGSLIKESSR